MLLLLFFLYTRDVFLSSFNSRFSAGNFFVNYITRAGTIDKKRTRARKRERENKKKHNGNANK